MKIVVVCEKEVLSRINSMSLIVEMGWGLAMKKLEASKMGIHLRISRVYWIDHISNFEIVEKSRNKIKYSSLWNGKLEYFGRVMKWKAVTKGEVL